MAEENGRVRSWNDKAALMRHMVAGVTVIVVGTFAWSSLTHKVDAADERTKQNKKEIETLKKGINELNAKQGVIINQLENDRRNQEKYQERTEDTLDRIERKLTQPEYRGR